MTPSLAVILALLVGTVAFCCWTVIVVGARRPRDLSRLGSRNHEMLGWHRWPSDENLSPSARDPYGLEDTHVDQASRFARQHRDGPLFIEAPTDALIADTLVGRATFHEEDT